MEGASRKEPRLGMTLLVICRSASRTGRREVLSDAELGGLGTLLSSPSQFHMRHSREGQLNAVCLV